MRIMALMSFLVDSYALTDTMALSLGWPSKLFNMPLNLAFFPICIWLGFSIPHPQIYLD